jgi:hypothetical protein
VKLAFFQGYVVTCDQDGRIPPDASVVAYPAYGFIETPGLKVADAVACDRRWLVATFNTMLATEASMSEKIADLLTEKSSLQQTLLKVTNERDALEREKKNG